MVLDAVQSMRLWRKIGFNPSPGGTHYQGGKICKEPNVSAYCNARTN